MGCKARRAAHSELWVSAATPQTAREGTCPPGWGEIGRLSQPVSCMGISPCGVPGRPTHPDCTPTRHRLDREQVLRARQGQGRREGRRRVIPASCAPATIDCFYNFSFPPMNVKPMGALSRRQNAAILAYMLKSGGYPVGNREIPEGAFGSPTTAELPPIKFFATRP